MSHNRHTEFQKVYVKDNGTGTITCQKCGNFKVVDFSPFLNVRSTIRVTCPCGFKFTIFAELRKYYRKLVSLPGEIINHRSPRNGPITVTDLSHSGIGFITSLPHELAKGDRVRVTFILDDTQNTSISREVIIQRVNKKAVGARFIDECVPSAFNFYLHP